MAERCKHDPRFERLERLLRGDLSPADAETASRHVASCEACSAERRAIEWDRGLLGLAKGAVPTHAAARAHEIVERAFAPGGRRVATVPRLVLATAGAVALLLLLLPFLRHDGRTVGDAPAVPWDSVATTTSMPQAPSVGVPKPPPVGPEVVVAERMERPRIRFGETVEVPAQADLVLRVPEGSAIALAGGTRASVGRGPAGTVVSLDRGLVECRVEPLAAGQSFAVRAPGLEVRVHGTRFIVRAEDGRSDVFVIEGRVEVRRGDSAPDLLGPSDLPSGLRPSPWLNVPGAEPAQATGGSGRPGAEPHHTDLVARARTLLGQRDYSGARAALERHLAARPGDQEAAYLLGEAQRLGGDEPGARETFERLARGRGRVAENALARLALLEARRGPAAALEAWDRYLAAFPNGTLAAEATLHRANALVALGRRAEARTALESFLRRFPDHPRRGEVTRRLEGIR